MAHLRADEGLSADRRSLLYGIGWVLMAFALFSTMDTMAKWLTAGYSLPQIVLTNTVFSQLTVLALLPRLGGWAALKTRHLTLHLLRGVIGVSGGFGVFFAFSRMPMADVYAIVFAAPLLITALSVPMLGETVGWRRWTAIAVGFVGVLIMLRPGQGMIDLGALGALGAAFGHSLSMLMVRRIGPTEPGVAYAFYTNSVGLALSGTLLLFSGGMTMPGGQDLLLSAGCGITGGLGLICITTGFGRSPAAVVAPFQYTQMLWGVLYGYVVFGDRPDLWLAIGGGIVIGSGLYILHRETRRATGPVSGGAAPVARPASEAS